MCSILLKEKKAPFLKLSSAIALKGRSFRRIAALPTGLLSDCLVNGTRNKCLVL